MLQGKLTQIPEASGQGPCRLRAGLVSAPHKHPEGSAPSLLLDFGKEPTSITAPIGLA